MVLPDHKVATDDKTVQAITKEANTRSSQKTNIFFRKTLSWNLLSHNAFSIVDAASFLAALHSYNFGL